MNRVTWKISSKIITSFFLLLCGVINVEAQSAIVKFSYPAEEVVSKMISAGEIADLSLIFPEEKDRRIRAEFFESLVTNKIIPIPKQGVAIKNVTIEGDINLAGQNIDNISLTFASFLGEVNLQGAKFENLSLSYCNFSNGIKLQKSSVFDSGYFNNTIFNGPVDFGFMDIGGILDLGYAHFNNPQAISFSNINIGGSAFIDNVIFEGPIDFSYANINQSLYFDESIFNSVDELNFNGLSVGNSVFFRDVNFFGPIDFGHTSIDANLDFSGTKFSSKDRLRFYSMQVSGSVLFSDAFFSGPLFFFYSQIGGIADFSNTEFSSPGVISFAFIDIKYGSSFEGSSFKGPVEFSYVDSSGPFNFNNTKFTNSDATIIFADVNVDGDFTLSNSSIAGVLKFFNSSIKNGFGAENINFLHPDESIEMSQVNAQSLAIKVSAAKGRIAFINCSFPDLFLGTQDNSEKVSIQSLSLSGTTISRNLAITNLNVKYFGGSHLLSLGNASIQNIAIEEDANLNFASFNSLFFQNVIWPEEPENLHLDGFIYNEIIPGSLTDANWRKLLALINNSSYNVALYRNLESYLNGTGHTDWANEVYISQKRRERSHILKWYSVKWWWNLFLDGFILFGRQPSRMFLWCTCIVLLGAMKFREGEMEYLGQQTKKFSSFWYSLDLFIPYIDLGIENQWRPKTRSAITYGRIHMILGWIVIPLALLSVSGLIK